MINSRKKNISDFINKIANQRNILYSLTKPNRLSTIYWYVASLRILNIEIENRDELIEYVLKCKNSDSFFGGDIDYPSNILATLNALQIFYILKHHYYDEKITETIHKYFNDDGTVCFDEYGETDTRFSCCVILILYFLYLNKNHKDCKIEYLNEKMNLNFLDKTNIKINDFLNHLVKCQNLDGGFGAGINSESHSANTFCVVSALRTLDLLHLIDTESVTRFLIYRQCSNGGLNGRINKKEDVCYSYWAFSALVMLEKDEYINKEELKAFIYTCLDESGGFADRKGNEPDLFHTLYALEALSMLGEPYLNKADPGVGI